MIVTFKSKCTGDLIYFKDIAIQLLRMMGRDDKVPSAMYAEDVPEALKQLNAALATLPDAKQKDDSPKDEQQGDDNAAKISLKIRAMPLLDMLERASKKQCAIHWE